MRKSIVKEASSPQPTKRTFLSPTLEQLSYLDAEPYIQDVYDRSSSRRHSTCMDQSPTQVKQTDDHLQLSGASNFGPTSNSCDRNWDDYITWDSIQSPMDLQPPWLTQSIQQSNASPFDEPEGLWLHPQQPESVSPMISGTDSGPFGSEQSRSSPEQLNQDNRLGSIDGFGDYLPPAGNAYPPLLTKSESTAMTDLTQDCGPASRSPSSTGPPSLKTGLQRETRTRSLSQSSTTSLTKSAPKRRQTSDAQSRKPRKGKSAAHNDVEKRYRTNLNVKITELSASIPSLCSMAFSENASGDEMDIEPKSGYPSKGIKKATILSKATEYIKTLEGDVQNLHEENEALKKRLTLCGRIASEGGSK